MALLPPPTQATATSGRRPIRFVHWLRASRPITVCRSRTIVG